MPVTEPDTTISETTLAQLRQHLDAVKGAAAGVASKADLTASSATSALAGWYNSFLSTDAVTQIDRWLRDTLTGDASIYDRAMDSHPC